VPGVRAANNPDWLFCLDWEDNADKTMSKAKAREWIEIVESALGRPGQCVIYSGNAANEKVGSKADPFFGARRLWLAQYGSTPKCQASWSTWWLWQYSGDGRVAGVDSACDVNIYDGPIDQLVAEWSGGAPAPGRF
jgi:lysozyme